MQNGEPSPSNPVEVQSVGDLVEEGENQGKYKIQIKVTGENTIDVEESYDIYLDEPLRKVGEHADYIDFVNNKVVRKIGYKETDFKFYSYTADKKYLYLVNSGNLFADKEPNNYDCISNKIKKFKSFPGSVDNNALMNDGVKFYYFVTAEEDEQESYINSLNGTKIYYKLADEYIKTEDIELPLIRSFNNMTNISINTTVQPSNIVKE